MTQQGWVSAETMSGELVVFRVEKINAIVRSDGSTLFNIAVYLDGDNDPFYLKDEFGAFFARVSQAHLPLV
jgi:hypothetical protein